MFEANNVLSVSRFAWFIRDNMTPEIAARINFTGLMLISNQGDGAKINDLLATMSEDIREIALSIFYTLDFANFEWFVESMIAHTLNGVDSEDHDSVGGFSQREIDLIISFFSE